MTTASPLLSVRDLSIVYETAEPVHAVQDVSFDLGRGELLGLAGESGSGKTTLAYGINRLLRPPAVIRSGTTILHGDDEHPDVDVNAMTDAELSDYRWDRVSMVFQGAMNALNPVLSIGTQMADVLSRHRPSMSRRERRDRCAELLELTGVGADRLRSYPHELSGGMRQRVTIAMALSLRPQLMIMDEPTTALDVLVQRDILHEIAELRQRFGFSIVFITHDLPLLLEISDRIAVMLQGRIVELSTAADLYRAPQSEYTQRLLQSFPSLTGAERLIDRGPRVAADASRAAEGGAA
ncbi:ABC transporter ATP-binding protein [Agrococcus jejuensis]|uniref:Peptide/nickel transport system ATP-binding protein n=1 Tax=Agrococcus jejuensis TaxID=399736 RepID=A0A1G8C907_9MICO|nr:ABC transporter ATP-binding protein [Agrococcus jejuensis]SDH41380.1 peptide/nickel transport system ATP-binding protein [Agrococcus jejuensis]